MTTTPAGHTPGSHTRGSQGEYSHRPMTWGTRGMVGAGTQLTAQSGMHVLWQGGNAVDAAVATALAAGVLEPTASYSLGGEVAFLFYDASAGKVRSVVGQGWVPEKATMDLYLDRWGEIPFGVLSTTVPGVISALLAMLADYGTMSFSQVAASALSFARDGFPTYQLLNHGITGWRDNIGKYPDSARVYLPGGKPPVLGSIFKQTDLANTLSMMVQEETRALGSGLGREAAIQAARDLFYKGDPARRMVKALQDLGGLYSNDDFGDYTSPWEEPVSTTYRGYEIFTNRTWTQGICLLQALNILENDDLASMGHNSVQAIHLQVESLKLAMADRERYVGDSDFQDIPVDGLLSKEYARLRRGLINPNAALADYPAGDPRGLQAVAGTNGSPAAPRALETPVGGADGTTYLATIDTQGNMVSATPSTFSGLSKGMVLGDTGILINNRGCYFWLDPDNANALQPRKRPRTTPCTFIILKDGKPFMTLGTPGADSQVPSDLQVLNNIIDFGLNLQEAVEAPRFGVNSFPRSPWPHETYPNQLDLEDRIPDGIAESLNDLGHRVDRVGPWGVSNGFAPVMVDPESGVYVGGADPRKESVVLGW